MAKLRYLLKHLGLLLGLYLPPSLGYSGKRFLCLSKARRCFEEESGEEGDWRFNSLVKVFC